MRPKNETYLLVSIEKSSLAGDHPLPDGGGGNSSQRRPNPLGYAPGEESGRHSRGDQTEQGSHSGQGRLDPRLLSQLTREKGQPGSSHRRASQQIQALGSHLKRLLDGEAGGALRDA